MRALRFLPLTYLAGLHGFVFFAPYIAALTLVDLLVLRKRRLALATIPATSPIA